MGSSFYALMGEEPVLSFCCKKGWLAVSKSERDSWSSYISKRDGKLWKKVLCTSDSQIKAGARPDFRTRATGSFGITGHKSTTRARCNHHNTRRATAR